MSFFSIEKIGISVAIWSLAGLVLLFATPLSFMYYRQKLWKEILWVVAIGPLGWTLGVLSRLLQR